MFRVRNKETGKLEEEQHYFRINTNGHLYYDGVPQDMALYIVEKGSEFTDTSGTIIFEGDLIQHPAFIDKVIFRNGMFTTEGCADCQPLYVHEPEKYVEIIDV